MAGSMIAAGQDGTVTELLNRADLHLSKWLAERGKR